MVSVLLLLLSLVALVLRLRRSRGEQRQQLRWLTAAAFALVAGFVLANLAGLGSDATRVWAVVPLFVAYASVPVAAGVAILRYRLYDIDLVINRAVVGAAVVIFVTLGYVTAVVLLGALVGGRVSEQYWASVVATALVALAFQPLRRGVQRLGDRAVYGRRAAPYQALADLCRRLARAVSLEQVLPGVAEVSGRSIGAAQATVRLAVAGADDVVAHWPTPPAPDRPASSDAFGAGVGGRRATRRDHGEHAAGTAGLRHGQDPARRHRHPGRAGDAHCPARGAAARPGGSGRRADRGARGLPAAAAGRPGVPAPATDPGGQRGGAASSGPAPGRARAGSGRDRPGRGESVAGRGLGNDQPGPRGAAGHRPGGLSALARPQGAGRRAAPVRRARRRPRRLDRLRSRAGRDDFPSTSRRSRTSAPSRRFASWAARRWSNWTSTTRISP